MLVRGKPPTIDNRALSWLEITLLTKGEETHEINTKQKINRNGAVKKSLPHKNHAAADDDDALPLVQPPPR